MFKFFTKNSANFKGLLFIVGLFIFAGIFLYTQELVLELKEKSTRDLKFKIKVFEENINNAHAQVDAGFFFFEVIKKVDFPVIYTDTERIPQTWVNIDARLDTLTSLNNKDSLTLAQILDRISQENPPIAIQYQNTVLGYYHYGYPPEINKIKNLPLITLFIGALFILFGYVGFTYIKRSEQRNIWVGMAKETAHQLGTPLSSLNGWLELLRLDINQKQTAFPEMENDLKRLGKVANRFSKIGSTPKLQAEDITNIISEVAAYFEKRLPNLGKQVKIECASSGAVQAMLNRDLFEWVLENLVKNALDAIEKEHGLIRLEIKTEPTTHTCIIDISDNGKGVAKNNRKTIFKPGFSTKKRGWGLGLSLAKRIVEEYHNGKIDLLDSKKNRGSTFRIKLNMP